GAFLQHFAGLEQIAVSDKRHARAERTGPVAAPGLLATRKRGLTMTEQTYFHKRDLPAVNRAVRAILQDRLTDTQYRRVALLYGFDGDPLSERQAAAVEGCGRPRVQRSREAALRKLRNNAELWFLWLMADGGLDDGDRGADPYQREETEGLAGRRFVQPIAYARSRAVDPAFSGNKGWPRVRLHGTKHWPQYDGTPGVADPHEDMHTVELHPGDDGW